MVLTSEGRGISRCTAWALRLNSAASKKVFEKIDVKIEIDWEDDTKRFAQLPKKGDSTQSVTFLVFVKDEWNWLTNSNFIITQNYNETHAQKSTIV